MIVINRKGCLVKDLTKEQWENIVRVVSTIIGEIGLKIKRRLKPES